LRSRVPIAAETALSIAPPMAEVPGTPVGSVAGTISGCRRERPGRRIVLTSGVMRAEGAKNLCEDGSLVPKPYAFEELERRIRCVLAAT